MTRTLKTFLLWLLIAVVPFQATAAGLRACASGHLGRNMTIVSPAGERTVQPSSLNSVNLKQTGIKGHCPDAGISKVSSVDKSDLSKHGACIACATFFVGVFAPPPAVNFPPTLNNPEVYKTHGTTPVVNFIPNRLKRPQRRFHA